MHSRYVPSASTRERHPQASFLAWKVMLEAGLQGVCRVAFAELALQTSQNCYVNNIIISLGVLVRHTRQPGLLFHPPAGLKLSARFHTMSLALCFRFHFLCRRVFATTNHYLLRICGYLRWRKVATITSAPGVLFTTMMTGHSLLRYSKLCILLTVIFYV